MKKFPSIEELSSATFRTNAEKASVAQSVRLLRAGKEDEAVFKAMVYNIMTKRTYHDSLKLMIWIHYWTGCRVSELLRVSRNDMLGASTVYIKASKGSEDRIVNMPSCPYVSNETRPPMEGYESLYSRHFVYRLYRNNNIMVHFSKGSNKSVTHVFRHLFAMRSLRVSNNREISSKSLGHKNTKNIRFYEHKEK